MSIADGFLHVVTVDDDTGESPQPGMRRLRTDRQLGHDTFCGKSLRPWCFYGGDKQPRYHVMILCSSTGIHEMMALPELVCVLKDGFPSENKTQRSVGSLCPFRWDCHVTHTSQDQNFFPFYRVRLK